MLVPRAMQEPMVLQAPRDQRVPREPQERMDRRVTRDPRVIKVHVVPLVLRVTLVPWVRSE